MTKREWRLLRARLDDPDLYDFIVNEARVERRSVAFVLRDMLAEAAAARRDKRGAGKNQLSQASIYRWSFPAPAPTLAQRSGLL